MSTEQNKSAKLEGAGGEWQEKTFSQLGKIVTGKTPPSAVSGFFGGNIPFVTPTDFDERRFISSTKRYLTEKGADSINSSRIPNMAIMISCIGSDMGKVAISETECFTNQQINSIIVEPDNNPIFIYYNLSNRKLEIRSVAGGSAQPILNKSAFGELNIILPPLEEQRAIAHILGTLDDKIELNRRTNETLEAMAQALFKFWFVDFGPVRAKMEGRWRRGQSLPSLPAHLFDLFPDRLVDSELGEIPEGWEIQPVYNIATYINGASYSSFQPNDQGFGLPIIKIAELKGGITSQTRFSEVQMPKKYEITFGDILFSWSGNPDTSIDIFIWSHAPAWLNQHIFRVLPKQQIERTFVVSTLKFLKPIFAEIARDKQTTGLGHVTVEDLKKLLVIKPSSHIMQEWDLMALPFFDKLLQNEVEINNLSILRDTLLPKLISGELRVKQTREE